MRSLVCLFLASGLLIAADNPKDAAKTDQDQIQGTWVSESADRDGKKLPDDEGKAFTFTFKGDKMTFKRGERVREATFKLDSTKKPKELTLKPAEGDKELKAIYTFDGQTLKICAGEPGHDRPKEMTTKDGDRLMLFVFKREKVAK